MGYGYYTLPDGREAGYGVEATCDKDGCEAKIDRGLGFLCGDHPDGYRADDVPGCGKYVCDHHLSDHACSNPECGKFSTDGDSYCGYIANHEGPHKDPHDGTEFTQTEEDEN